MKVQISISTSLVNPTCVLNWRLRPDVFFMRTLKKYQEFLLPTEPGNLATAETYLIGFNLVAQ